MCMRARFAMLPEDVKKSYENEESHYSVGWSHGKEKLQVWFLLLVWYAVVTDLLRAFSMIQGKPDFSKGSYYNNPLHNRSRPHFYQTKLLFM